MHITSEDREVEKVVKETERVYVVELSEGEAEIVRELAGNITGSGPAREVTTALYRQLGAQGVRYPVGFGANFEGRLTVRS